MFKKINRLFYIVAYSLIFTLSVAAGIKYVIIKNKQTLVQREIDDVQKRTIKNTNLLNQYKAELQSSNNRFLLREQIAEMETGLQPISNNSIVTIKEKTNQRLAESK